MPTIPLLATLLLTAATTLPVAPQQGPDIARSATDSLRAFLVTFGPGPAVWERFGHNALWIHDPATGTTPRTTTASST
jgi:hypothetical protein